MADAGQAAPVAQPAAPVAASDPVARIQAIIDREPGNSPSKRIPAQQAQTTPAPQEQVPAQPEAQPAPQEQEALAGPNKQSEGDDAPAEDARRVAEIPLDQLEAIELELEYEAGGEKVAEKKTIKELRQGYMRDQDYRKKTTDLARQRELIPQETRKAVEAERSQYLKELQTMHDLVTQTAASELNGVDWNDLAQNNAFEYVRLDNRRKQITETLNTISSKQQEVLSKHQAEQTAATRQAATKARAQLEADIPGFNDALYQTLLKHGIEKSGFKQEEVTTWVDPRAIKLLHKAYLYDQLQAEKTQPSPDKRVVVPPKVVRPGAAQDSNPARQRERSAMERLQTSGKIQDAAAVIKSRMR